MNLRDLIEAADEVNETRANPDWDESTKKELAKIEMYCRKTYLMLSHVAMLQEGGPEKDFIPELTAGLVRDQKYIKARDSLEDYAL